MTEQLSNFGIHSLGNGPIHDRPILNPRPFEIFYILSELVRPETVLEIGTWEGRSALSWGEATREWNASIICVDTWLGSVEHYQDQLSGTEWGRDRLFLEDGYPTIYNTFVTNMRASNIQDRVFPVPIDSRQAFIILKKAGVVPDICYIDAAHDYDSVLSDLNGAKDIGSKIICGDDYYYYNSQEIKFAVDDFSKENNMFGITKQNQFVLFSEKNSLYNSMIGFGWNDC